MEKFRLTGKVTEGTFPNECVVVFQDYKGDEVGVVVPARQVQQIDGKAAIEVRALESKGGYTLVRLPGELLTSLGHTASVKDSQLERA